MLLSRWMNGVEMICRNAWRIVIFPLGETPGSSSSDPDARVVIPQRIEVATASESKLVWQLIHFWKRPPSVQPQGQTGPSHILELLAQHPGTGDGTFWGRPKTPTKTPQGLPPDILLKFFGRHPCTAVYHRIRFVTILSRCFLCFVKCYEEMLRLIFHIFHLQFHPCQLFKHMPVVTANYISEHILAPSREGNKKKTPQRSTKYSFSMKNHWLSRKTQGNSWKMREFKL